MVLPTENAIRHVIQRTASLRHYLGSEIGNRPLVLPDSRDFPDLFTGDAASVARLMRRIQEHAGMTDVPLQTRLLGGSDANHAGCHSASGNEKHQCKGDCGGKGCDGCDGSCHDEERNGKAGGERAAACGTGCGSGCGPAEGGLGNQPRIVDQGDCWIIQVHVSELNNPAILTTILARAVGYVFLAETRGPNHPAVDDLNEAADLASTLLGFGSLLLNGAHIYSKSCGGPRIARVTAIRCEELAFATVLFAEWQKHDLRPLQKKLPATQSAALDEAIDWLKARPSILEQFVGSPASLARGDIPMARVSQGLFSRLFGKRPEPSRVSDDPGANLAELEAMLASAGPSAKTQQRRQSDPKADELRALVDEAFADPGS